PEPYLMRPFRIMLAYRSRHWLSVTFELGHDEVGSTDHYELRIASDIVDLFEDLGLETPQPIPVMALDHRVAQKLHACTSVGPRGGNDSAHDLVELHILDQEEEIDLAAVGATARRLFTSRRAQGPLILAAARLTGPDGPNHPQRARPKPAPASSDSHAANSDRGRGGARGNRRPTR